MRAILACAAFAVLLAGCGPKVEKQQSGAASAATASAASVAFKLEPLGEGEGDVQGCQTMLSGAEGGDIFRASAADSDAQGFLKIDGAVVKVDLVSSKGDEKSQVRTFVSADKKTTVVERLASGEAHPESDSVEQSGELDVTHNGAQQSFKVQGGTAC